ncbi:MAG: hypothetical protein AAF740_13715, partial [Bacteroidota bacterium]
MKKSYQESDPISIDDCKSYWQNCDCETEFSVYYAGGPEASRSQTVVIGQNLLIEKRLEETTYNFSYNI